MSRASSLPWQRIVTIYVLVQFAEIFGVAMIYAYLPLALEGAGVPLGDIATVSGAATAGISGTIPTGRRKAFRPGLVQFYAR